MSTLRAAAQNPAAVVAEARMIYSSKSKCQTIVVEGDSDFRLLRNWLNDKCARLKSVNGKDHVKEVWKIAKNRSFQHLHCIADLDYDLIANYRTIIDPQFIYVSMELEPSGTQFEGNDLEAVLIRSSTFVKFVAQKLSKDEISSENFRDRVTNLRESLRKASRNIGAFRAADLHYRKENGHSPIGGNFEISETFFDPLAIETDVQKISQLLLNSSASTRSAMQDLIDIALDFLKKYPNDWQLCRGHDLTCMLGLHISKKIGRFVSRREVEEDLRMACELQTIFQTRFGKKLREIGNDFGRAFTME